jgi:succinoglycan biosynthesis protein ExoA
MKLSKISVVIPVKPGREAKLALKALKKVNYPAGLVEVIVAYGFNPSRQRNMAVNFSKGEIIYFLDDNSEIAKQAFRKVNDVFAGKTIRKGNSGFRGFSFFPKSISNIIQKIFFSAKIYKGEIGAVGGPNVWSGKENFWETISGTTQESFFLQTKMAARHRPIGYFRRASEKELVLCNLAVRRNVFKKIGGFSEELYPNEENELLNRFENAGYQLAYHPQVKVERPRRQSLNGLLVMFYNYGRGRMEQIHLEGVVPNLPLMSPLLLIIYLLSLAIVLGTNKNGFINAVFLCPIIIYLLMSLGSAGGSALRKNKMYLVIFLPVMFLIAHLTYALGLIGGLFSNLKKRRTRTGKAKIEIVKLKKFGDSWQKYDYDRMGP